MTGCVQLATQRGNERELTAHPGTLRARRPKQCNFFRLGTVHADDTLVSTTTFTDRSYRVSDTGGGIVCDTPSTRADLESLRDALAWRRNTLSLTALDQADAVIALQAVIALDDRLLAAAELGDDGRLTLTRQDTCSLCELAGAYIAERDVDGFQPLKERDRIARLRTLSGRLMDACAEFTAAEAEAREKSLIA